MKCNFCGAELPDGSKVCYECGARLTQAPVEDDVFKAVRVLKSGVASQDGESTLMKRAGTIADHLKILAIGYSVEAIVSIVILAITIILTSAGSATDDATAIFKYISTGASLVSFVCLWIAMARLKEYDDGIEDAYKYFIAYVICALISGYIQFLSIVVLVLVFIYYNKLFGGLSSLCRNFPDLSDKWGKLFRVMIICMVVGIIAIIALVAAVYGSSGSEGSALLIGYAASFILIIPNILSMIYALQSRKAFADYAIMHGSRTESDF